VDRQLLAQGILSTEKNVTDLSEVRLVLESEPTSSCARRAPRRDLAALEDLASKMKIAKEKEEDQ
jgi:DNA-binding FadR family transcriptional regulator